jgi:hypothetical protein
MLDAFIIERIRQQREQQDSSREPLRVEVPLQRGPEPLPPRSADEPDDPERGSVIIDDTI